MRFVLPKVNVDNDVKFERIITSRSPSYHPVRIGVESLEEENPLHRCPSVHLLPSKRMFLKPELLCNLGCETPRINTECCIGRQYRYFYAISSDVDLENPGTVLF